MNVNSIDISAIYNLEGQATLDCYIHGRYNDKQKEYFLPAVIVAPGGGYGFLSKREGEPIASYFLAKGFNAFVLNYSVAPVCYPAQLLQLASAVDYVKKNAQELHIDAERIYTLGFSAGGHLVGNLAAEWHSLNKTFGVSLDCMPTAAALCYPVINVEYIRKEGNTYKNLLRNYSEQERGELLKKLNLDCAVTSNVPPCFVWATAEDTVTYPQGALSFTKALLDNGIRCELHMYPTGGHGLATADEQTNEYQPFMDKVHTWLPMCADFFKSVK